MKERPHGWESPMVVLQQAKLEKRIQWSVAVRTEWRKMKDIFWV